MHHSVETSFLIFVQSLDNDMILAALCFDDFKFFVWEPFHVFWGVFMLIIVSLFYYWTVQIIVTTYYRVPSPQLLVLVDRNDHVKVWLNRCEVSVLRQVLDLLEFIIHMLILTSVSLSKVESLEFRSIFVLCSDVDLKVLVMEPDFKCSIPWWHVYSPWIFYT